MSIMGSLFRETYFAEREEFSRFRYRFFGVIVAFGFISSSLFLLASYFGVNKIPENDLIAMRIHVVSSMVTWLLLRICRQWFYQLCWVYGSITFYVITAALIWVPSDELRILWFFLSIPAYYLLLGRIPGVGVTLLSMLVITWANRYAIVPYSPNAIATGLIGMVYISAFFFVYMERAHSFFNRMIESNEQLRYLASHDPLTGVLNARTYYEVANHLIAIAQRELSSYSVLFVDLDHFKSINDTHGHESGDLVLKAATSVLQSECRESDILGRVGGEEFSVFLPNTDLEGALVVANKLRKAIEELMPSIDGKTLRITASIGVAVNQNSYGSIADVQRDADQAMYAAKQKGRNCVSSLF